jgi:hypothetical protein
MVSIVAHPRPIVRVGNYYGPKPRRSFEELKQSNQTPAIVCAEAPAAAAAP